MAITFINLRRRGPPSPAKALLLTACVGLGTWASPTGNSPGLPFVINTWSGPFTAATDAAFDSLISPPGLQFPSAHFPDSSAAALDAVQVGLSVCERDRCDGTVGPLGSRDEACETTLDALLIDGATLDAGAVASLRRIRDAAAVARHVLEYTRHTLLAGDLATRFAIEMGFPEEDISKSAAGDAECEAWRQGGCKGNFRVNVTPDPSINCGPYKPSRNATTIPGNPPTDGQPPELVMGHSEPALSVNDRGGRSHDTISMVAITSSSAMAAGTSTNGATHKVPGRVGDGPIMGSGSYVDSDVGGCGATGDGDIMMRFLPCYQAVESLRRGMTPTEAAEDAVRRMVRKYPDISTGIVVVNNRGDHGAAASGWTFTYSFRGGDMDHTETVTVPPVATERETRQAQSHLELL